MHGAGAALARGSHVLRRIEIRRNLHGGVRSSGVKRAAVVRRNDRDRLDSE